MYYHNREISLCYLKNRQCIILEFPVCNCHVLQFYSFSLLCREVALVVIQHNDWRQAMRNKTKDGTTINTPMRKLIKKLPGERARLLKLKRATVTEKECNVTASRRYRLIAGVGGRPQVNYQKSIETESDPESDLFNKNFSESDLLIVLVCDFGNITCALPRQSIESQTALV